MHFSAPAAVTAVLSLASAANGLKILLGNDDGFGSGNIRELYKLLKGGGHDVYIVAPATDQSGQGGRAVFSSSPNLTTNSEFDLIKAGAPALGPDPNDNHIWYYNGTPAAVTFVALDYVLPKFSNWSSGPDLFVSGPNFGTNLGPFLYTISGTIGSTYAAIERSIPGIAISASNSAIPYYNVTNSSNPATWAAKVAYKVVNQFIAATPKGQAVLPLGYGINVNIPALNSTYNDPPIVRTRLTGNADVDKAVYNETTKTFTYGNLNPPAAGVNTALNGDVTLPGETYVVEGGKVSVSVFSVDYDAPSGQNTDDIWAKVAPITTNAAIKPTTRKRESYHHA